MHLFSTVFFGLAANLDNFGVGVSFGVRKIRIPIHANSLIALSSGAVALISVFAGQTLSGYMTWANLGGALLLVAIGIWIMLHRKSSEVDIPLAIPAMRQYRVSLKPTPFVIQVFKSPSKADMDANGVISAKESLALGASLSLNCIATGIGAGLTGLSPLPVALCVILFSFLTISAGYFAGWKTVAGRFERLSQILSGLLLVLIGIYEMFKV